VTSTIAGSAGSNFVVLVVDAPPRAPSLVHVEVSTISPYHRPPRPPPGTPTPHGERHHGPAGILQTSSAHRTIEQVWLEE